MECKGEAECGRVDGNVNENEGIIVVRLGKEKQWIVVCEGRFCFYAYNEGMRTRCGV